MQILNSHYKRTISWRWLLLLKTKENRNATVQNQTIPDRDDLNAAEMFQISAIYTKI